MASRTTPEEQQEWADRHQRWKATGKSAAQWCREHDINYSQFLYMKERLVPSGSKLRSTSSFLEMTNASAPEPSITIESQGVLIHVSKQFEEEVLLRCLRTLRRL